MSQNADARLAAQLFDAAFACINLGRVREGRQILQGLARAYGMPEPLLIDARLEAMLQRDPSVGVAYILQRVVARFGLLEQARVSLVPLLQMLDDKAAVLEHCSALVESANRSAREFACVVARDVRATLRVTDAQALAFAKR